MLTRRDLVKWGLASVALPAMAGGGGALASSVSPLHKMVFDGRLPASRIFGARAQKLGAPIAVIHGDVTALWFHDLHFLWQSGSRAAVAGLTRPSSLFALEQMALLAGRRVVFRAEHHEQAAGNYTHRVATPSGFATLADRSPDWAAHMAQAMVQNIAPVSNHLQAHAMMAAPASDRHVLVSWIIAAV